MRPYAQRDRQRGVTKLCLLHNNHKLRAEKVSSYADYLGRKPANGSLLTARLHNDSVSDRKLAHVYGTVIARGEAPLTQKKTFRRP